jgi:hypothetical protein
MKTSLLALTVAPLLLLGADNDELALNRQLKAELASERKELQAAQEKNREAKRSIETLEQTIAAIDGEPVASAAQPAARLLFANSFNENFADFGRNPKECDAAIIDAGDGKALRITSADGKKSACLQRGFAVPEGCTLRLSVKIKAEKVARLAPRRHDGSGTKFMLMVTKDGKTVWPDAPPQEGSFDWMEQSFQSDIPFGVKNVILVLGLQGASGAVYFKDLKVEALER